MADFDHVFIFWVSVVCKIREYILIDTFKINCYANFHSHINSDVKMCFGTKSSFNKDAPNNTKEV